MSRTGLSGSTTAAGAAGGGSELGIAAGIMTCRGTGEISEGGAIVGVGDETATGSISIVTVGTLTATV